MSNTEAVRLTYQDKKTNGICVQCGKSKALPNKVLCEKCKEKANENSKRAYQHYKSRGICVDCRTKKAEPNRVRCKLCLMNISEMSAVCHAVKPFVLSAEQKENRRIKSKELYHYRKSHGLCVSCGKKAMTGITRCKKCNDKMNSQNRLRRLK